MKPLFGSVFWSKVVLVLISRIEDYNSSIIVSANKFDKVFLESHSKNYVKVNTHKTEKAMARDRTQKLKSNKPSLIVRNTTAPEICYFLLSTIFIRV